MAKRVLDFTLSLGGLIMLSPLFLMIAIFIKLDSPGPVFFRQTRIGQYGHEFKIYKFRTMVTEAEKLGQQITVAGDRRITRIGKLLRQSKLDELPQLINVFKGEMSLVGPRPEVPKYVNLYTSEQRQVLNVKPGITDPASIQFSNESEILAGKADPEAAYIQEIMPQKLELNQQYINQANLVSDFRIILQTIIRIIAA